MPPHNPQAMPANDRKPLSTREAFELSVAAVAPQLPAMSIAWDEAAACLARRDAAGFDAAMRIFRAIEKGASL